MAFMLGALGGISARDYMPFQFAKGWKRPTVKLRLYIQGIRPTDGHNRPKPGRRFFVTAMCGGGVEKKTEFADWSEEAEQWQFGEVLTLEIDPDDEVEISWLRSEGCNLVIAQLDKPAQVMGHTCIPMTQLLPQLQRQERELDGHVFAKADIPIDLNKDGGQVGKLYASFEIRRMPSREHFVAGDPWSACTAPCLAPDSHELAIQLPSLEDPEEPGFGLDSARTEQSAGKQH